MSRKSQKSEKPEKSPASPSEEAPTQVTLDWLSKRLAEISIRAKDKEDLKTEMLALNSLARLHRIQGDGDLSLIPGKLMVEFVHTRLSDERFEISADATIPLLSGTLQDPVWREGKWEELGRSQDADHAGGG